MEDGAWAKDVRQCFVRDEDLDDPHGVGSDLVGIVAVGKSLSSDGEVVVGGEVADVDPFALLQLLGGLLAVGLQ